MPRSRSPVYSPQSKHAVPGVDAHYKYDAYGNTVVSTGGFADDNPFRFSTKYCDDELDYAGTDNDGLCYFGYRYYSPRLGRWINRDPIQELGHELVKSVASGRGSGLVSIRASPPS